MCSLNPLFISEDEWFIFSLDCSDGSDEILENCCADGYYTDDICEGGTSSDCDICSITDCGGQHSSGCFCDSVCSNYGDCCGTFNYSNCCG